MANEGRAALKAYFQTGDIPTQAQFENLIDSMVNKTDDIVPLEMVVKITQVGVMAPELVALKNTAGSIITGSNYDDVGVYRLTGTFLSSKISVSVENAINGDDAGLSYFFSAWCDDDNTIQLRTVRSGTPFDEMFNGTQVLRIQIYP